MLPLHQPAMVAGEGFEPSPLHYDWNVVLQAPLFILWSF